MMRDRKDDEKYKGARVIGLANGMQTLVDECDWAEMSRYKWYMEKSCRSRYVFRKCGGNKSRMHREITGAGAGMVVDHIDHDGLNNRRGNLRVCTIKQNSQNSRGQKGTSKYKGVSWVKEKKKWRASIGFNGRKTTIGYFEKEIDAGKAYDEYARELFGEYAYLNFPAL